MEHWRFHTPFGFTEDDIKTTVTNNPDGSKTTFYEYSNGLKVKATQKIGAEVDFLCNKKLIVDEEKKEILPDMSVDNPEWKD